MSGAPNGIMSNVITTVAAAAAEAEAEAEAAETEATTTTTTTTTTTNKKNNRPERHQYVKECSPTRSPSSYIILFYKHHGLSSDRQLMELYRLAMDKLCLSLELRGRLLIGVSDDAEGIIGTLAGNTKEQVLCFTYALLGKEYCHSNSINNVNTNINNANNKMDASIDNKKMDILETFWARVDEFCNLATEARRKKGKSDGERTATEIKATTPLIMDSPNEFKWSASMTETSETLFPDLHIKLVKELINTGGIFSSMTIDQTSQGTLTPQEWHEAMMKMQQQQQHSPSSSSVLIDCHNTKECQIGHFPGAINPDTTPFAQFPQWVQNNCGDSKCSGACWGFHSLKRKELLKKQYKHPGCTSIDQPIEEEQTVSLKRRKICTHQNKSNNNRPSAGKRKSKVATRQRAIQEIMTLGLAKPPKQHRDPKSGIRVPPPIVRQLQTNVKGKWCGQSALKVVQEEFADVANDFENMLQHGLLRVNKETLSRDKPYILKNMDTITRLVHWHEPPIVCPPSIYVQRVALPQSILQKDREQRNNNENENYQAELIVCDKPSTVPVHPVGPYLSNSLTMMIEAQLQMIPRTLHPCHRIDRVTSGLLLCASDNRVARFVQSRLMESRRTKKLYLARVSGRFPDSTSAAEGNNYHWEAEFCYHPKQHDHAKCKLVEVDPSIDIKHNKTSNRSKFSVLQVDAPIFVADAKSGIRTIDAAGKASTSRFWPFAYRESDNTSLVVCRPITGRGHQLRVHLQYLGFPILGDILYGGRAAAKSTDQMNKAVELLQCSTASNDSDHEHQQHVIDACRCCASKEGIIESFTSAQLLKEGHSICLHAFRYKLLLGDEDCSSDHSLTLSVPVPVWADEIDTGDKVKWI